MLKTTRSKKKKHNKIVMLARSKLNSIESKISKALTNNEISHEDYEAIINEEKKYWELKDSIRMMNSQRSNAEKKTWLKRVKKIGINEVIKRNEIINRLKPWIWCWHTYNNEIILFKVQKRYRKEKFESFKNK